MTRFEVVPGTGLDGVAFGEPRSVHRERLGNHQPFERTPGAGVTDAYLDSTLMLSYDENDLLSLIEIGGADVTWNGILLVDRPLEEILDDLAKAGIRPQLESDLYVVPSLGMRLYTPAPDEPEVNVEGVSLAPIGRE
jgi:hypothetical protein